MTEEQDPVDGGPPVDLSAGLESVEEIILGEKPHLTRVQVTEQAGVPLEVARELWRLLGLPERDDDDVAFTEADVQALRYTRDLMKLGVLSPERPAALVRTWGRSFARLAEWQTRFPPPRSRAGRKARATPTPEPDEP